MRKPRFHPLDWTVVGVLVGGALAETYRYFTHQGVDWAASLLLALTAVCYFQMRKDRIAKKEPIQASETTRGKWL